MGGTIKEVFTSVLEDEVWGRGSGPGSAPDETIGYRCFLQQFLSWNDIETVVDLGCGDWQFSRFMDWSGVRYTGADVVHALVTANQKSFGSDNVNFIETDGRLETLPDADLLIAKDVLQHLNTRDIQEFLAHVDRYRFVLVTNCVEPAPRINAFIKSGGFRPVDLRRKPFNLNSTVVFSYPSHGGRKDVQLL